MDENEKKWSGFDGEDVSLRKSLIYTKRPLSLNLLSSIDSKHHPGEEFSRTTPNLLPMNTSPNRAGP
jgi:hypothetical protein